MRGNSTGSVWKHPKSGRWYITYTPPGAKTVRESSGSTGRQDAVNLLRKRVGEIADGAREVGPAIEKLTVSDLLKRLATKYETHGQNLSTLNAHVKALAAVLDSEKAVNVTHARLEKIASAWLKEGFSNGTVNRRFGILRAAYNLAQTDHHSLHVPKFPHFSEKDAVRRWFVEPADFDRFLAALPDDGLRDYIRWLGVTGSRRGEARKLRWSYLSHDGTTLHVPAADTKNGEPRDIPLAGALKEIIARRREARKARPECSFIFYRLVYGEPCPVREFREPWQHALEATGLRLTPHDLRRSAVRNLIRSGLDPDTARAISGHKTPHIFSRYNIISESDMRRGLEQVSRYLTQAATQPQKVAKLA